jgi:hypothetical protein
MCKFICLLLMLITTPGCCQLFGLCTSVNVHTSASSPNKFASSHLFESGERPASVVVSNQRYLPPDGEN